MSTPADNVLARELAIEATSLHLLDQHDAALQTLQRLEALLPDDPAVQHNLLVAGWYADTGTSIQSLAQELEACVDATRKQEGANSAQTASTVASINYAALLHMQQQHAKALQILEPLYLLAESMHGGLAVCLCVLLLEIYLGSDQHAKAAQVLHYLQCSLAPEVPLRTASVDDEVGADSASGSPTARCTSPGFSHLQVTAVQQSPKLLRSPGQLRSLQQSPKPRRELLAPVQQEQQEEAELQEQEHLRSMPVGLDVPLVSRVTSSTMQQVQQLVGARNGTVLGVDVPALLHLYKARLAMACGNFKAAKKEVRGLTSLYPDSPAGVLFKCEMEVLRQQPKKALKTLAPLLAAPTDCTTRCKLQLLNLLAAVHHQLGKNHVAALYLSAALEQQQQAYRQQQHGQHQEQQHSSSQQSQQQQAKRPKQRRVGKKQQQQQHADSLPATPSSGCSQWLFPDQSDALQYNLGLQQLLLGNWQAALQCLEAASSSYYNQCAVWLRLAEANISLYHKQQQQAVPPGAHHQQRQPQQQQQQQQQQQRQQSKGRPAASNATTVMPIGGSVSDQTDGTLLLQQAAQQLSSGLALLQEQQAEAAKQAEAAAAAMSAAAAAAAAAEDQFFAREGQAVSSSLGSPWFQLGLQTSPVCHTGSLGSIGSPDAAAAAATSLLVDGGDSSNNTPVALPAASGAGVIAGSMLEAYTLPPDLSSLQQALLANQAYVHLLLQQPGPALTAAQALLACSSNSCHYHYLGSCYAAEALLLLGRSDEAVEQLQGQLAQVVDSNSSGGPWGSAGPAVGSLPTSDLGHHLSDASAAAAKNGSSSAVCQASPSQMQAALLANLSSVHAVQGDCDDSRQDAAAAVAADPGITASPDVVFLDLQSGERGSSSSIAGLQ